MREICSEAGHERNSRHQRVVGGRWDRPSDSGSAMGGGRKVAGLELV